MGMDIIAKKRWLYKKEERLDEEKSNSVNCSCGDFDNPFYACSNEHERWRKC